MKNEINWHGLVLGLVVGLFIASTLASVYITHIRTTAMEAGVGEWKLLDPTCSQATFVWKTNR
jgi:hypothetical protein